MTPVLRRLFRTLGAASPPLAARLADLLFCTPPRSRAPRSLAALQRTGRRFELTVDRRRVVGWRWGDGPAVLLVHGWGSRGSRLGVYVPPLTQAGYSVVAFDAPGHGASGWGTSSLPEFARSALALRHVTGPVHAVVAHSLGGAATMLAMRWGLEARRVALIAPPANPLGWVDRFAELFQLERDVVALMRERMERRLRFSWTELDMLRAARDMDAPAMVVHDRDDPTVPWQDGAAVAGAWPGAKLVTTEGLGHRDIVRDPAIVRAVTDFVADEAPPVEATWLEQELFNRPLRWARMEQAHPR